MQGASDAGSAAQLGRAEAQLKFSASSASRLLPAPANCQLSQPPATSARCSPPQPGARPLSSCLPGGTADRVAARATVLSRHLGCRLPASLPCSLASASSTQPATQLPTTTSLPLRAFQPPSLLVCPPLHPATAVPTCMLCYRRSRCCSSCWCCRRCCCCYLCCNRPCCCCCSPCCS